MVQGSFFLVHFPSSLSLSFFSQLSFHFIFLIIRLAPCASPCSPVATPFLGSGLQLGFRLRLRSDLEIELGLGNMLGQEL